MLQEKAGCEEREQERRNADMYSARVHGPSRSGGRQDARARRVGGGQGDGAQQGNAVIGMQILSWGGREGIAAGGCEGMWRATTNEPR